MADNFLKIGGQDSEGLARGLSTSKTGQVKTQNGIGVKSEAIRDNHTLAYGEEKIIFDTSKPFRLDTLVFVTDSLYGSISMQEKGSGKYVGDLMISGDNMINTIENIVSENSSLWEINNYQEGKYKVTFRRPLDFPKGITIRTTFSLEGPPSDPINSAVKLYGVEYDD